MPNHRNLSFRKRPHQFHTRPLDLHRLGASFFDEPHSIGHALRQTAVIAAKRHIGHHQRPAHRSANSACVMQHLVHSNGQGIVMAQHHHGQRIAHQNHVDSGLVDQARSGVVVSRQRSNWLALALHPGKRGHGHFGCQNGSWSGCVSAPSGEAGNAHFYLQCRSVHSGCGPNPSESTPNAFAEAKRNRS